MADQYRSEKDILGVKKLPKKSLYGIHTARALENFPLSGHRIHPALISAYGQVKQACIETCISLGVWNDTPKTAAAIVDACQEMVAGRLNEHIVVDQMQGGAGTSTNMNVNEVLANRALEILKKEKGDDETLSPLDDVNKYQSTNDTYPTALKLAAIQLISVLEQKLVGLQESFQAKEKEFSHIVKIGRTQYQDAVLTTLGREMGAYAEAMNRDRWRVYKCQERLRVVNLGGTAIGTGLGAPRQYIFRVVDKLRELTGIGFARSENLVDGTQNADVFVEVSGILKACASTLLKVCSDLRLLSSGPQAGLGELILPQCQAGSSIMPGKINPVIPESVSQAAMLVMGHDQVIAQACAAGSLELNPFLPLVAKCLLESIDLLSNACESLRVKCIEGLKADENQCRKHVESSTATVTALLPAIGYQKACQVAQKADKQKKTIKQIVIEENLLTEEQFEALLTPEAVCRLGFPEYK